MKEKCSERHWSFQTFCNQSHLMKSNMETTAFKGWRMLESGNCKWLIPLSRHGACPAIDRVSPVRFFLLLRKESLFIHLIFTVITGHWSICHWYNWWIHSIHYSGVFPHFISLQSALTGAQRYRECTKSNQIKRIVKCVHERQTIECRSIIRHKTYHLNMLEL